MAEVSDVEIVIEVCYARPDRLFLKRLRVPEGTNIEQAVHCSGVLQEVPELDLAQCRVGIYGKVKSLDTLLRERDRVEVYRPLVADPMEARRRRAAHKEVHKRSA